MGLVEKRNELITGINVVLRKNMKDEDRRKELYRLIKSHEEYVVDSTVNHALDKMREGSM